MILNKKNAIPKNAKRVFKGKIFEVWQWKQKMFDGSTEIFEHLKRPDTAQVIPVVGNKILIQTQKQPDRAKSFSSLAGGRCDWGEDPFKAAKRELLEETGYASKDWVLWKEQNPVSKIEWTIYTYIARNCYKKQPPKPDSGERIKNRLITFEEFLMLSEDPYFYEKELAGKLLRARFEPKLKKELFNLLFKK